MHMNLLPLPVHSMALHPERIAEAPQEFGVYGYECNEIRTLPFNE